MPTKNKEARGIRLNNPGNIRKSKDKWQGLALDQPDQSFVKFKDPTYGIRAMARLFIKYQDDYDLDTVKKLISRWAPPVENDTGAYYNTVSKQVGVLPNEKIDTHEFKFMLPFLKAVIKHENGYQPYTDAQLTKGLVLAGVEPQDHKDKTIASTNTVKVATAGAAVTVAQPVLSVLEKVEEHSYTFDRIAQYGPWALAAVGILLFGYFVYTRWDDRRKGLR